MRYADLIPLEEHEDTVESMTEQVKWLENEVEELKARLELYGEETW